MVANNGNGSGRRMKVAHLIDEYDLDGVSDEVLRLWTAEGDERQSLRELADEFNRRLLGTAPSDAGVQLVPDEVEGRYRVLAEKSGDPADRTRVRRRLEREGVEVDELLNDFVSYQALRTHLTEYRDAEYVGTDTDPVESAVEGIQRLLSRTVAVTESKFDQLRKADEITLVATGRY